MGDDSEGAILREETVTLQSLVNGQWSELSLSNVLFVPDMNKNLVSVGVCTNKGYTVIHENNQVRIVYGNVNVLTGVKQLNNLYSLCVRAVIPEYKLSATVASFEVWHKRLGHVNLDALKNVSSSDLVDGFDIKGKKDKFFCEPCQFGKAHKLPFNRVTEQRNTRRGELFHTDLVGPMSVPSLGKSNYFLLLTDDASAYKYVYFIQHKSDLTSQFKISERLNANQFGEAIKTIRSDRGGEYINKVLGPYLCSIGIVHEQSTPYTAEQNGKSERHNRTVIECARTLMHAADATSFLWAEAVNCAVYMLNRVTTPTRYKSKTSYEIWTGRKPNVSHFKIFGTKAYEYIPKQFVKKLDKRCKKAQILVGYDGDSPNYRLFDPEKKRISVSRHVNFNENEYFQEKSADSQISLEIFLLF